MNTLPAAKPASRLPWRALPESLRDGVTTQLGAPVVETGVAEGGFSPGFAGSVRSASGARAFVKAMARSTHPGWVFLYEREAFIAPALPAGAPFPRLRFTIDDGDWVLLAFDWIDGRAPTTPWCTGDLERVLAAVTALSAAGTPSPVDVETAGVAWGEAFTRWRDIAADDARVAALPGRWADHLPELVALEADWPAATAGESLVHLDLRGDNVLLTVDDVYVVDWAFAARAARWVDLVCLLPSVAVQGGPDPETQWRAHPWHTEVDPPAFDAFLAAWTGMLTHVAGSRGGPMVDALTAFHAGQAAAARAWLAQRRGWSDVLSAVTRSRFATFARCAD